MMVATTAPAQQWDAGGAATNLNWGNAANWDPDGIPAAGSTVTFGATGSSTTAGTVTSIVDVNTSVGSLQFNHTAANQFHTVQINSGATLTIDGAGGIDLGSTATNAAMTTNVAFTGGGTLALTGTTAVVDIALPFTTINSGSAHTATLNLSTLGAFTTNIADLRIGYGSLVTGNLLLSDTSNTITANNIQLGHSNGANASSVSTMTLGAGENILRVTNLNIGLSKAFGTLSFASQTPGSAGTVTIGGKTAGSAANITAGSTNGTGGTSATPTGTLDLRGHVATVTANVLTLGKRDGSGAGGASGNVYFDAGTFTANTISMAAKTGSGTGQATALLSIGGGTFTVNAGGSFSLASQSGTGTASGKLEIKGGTFVSNVDIIDGGGAATSTIELIGTGVLDMRGNAIGDATNAIDTLNFQSGTLMNVGEVNGGLSQMTKSGAGTLVLDGINTYTGGTRVTGGVLQIGSGGTTGTIGTGGIQLQGGAIAFHRSDEFQVTESITGSGGGIRQTGTGRTSIMSANSGLDAAVVVVSDGILRAGNSLALGTFPEITVESGAQFTFATNSATPQTLSTAFNLTLQDESILAIGVGDTIATFSAVTAGDVILKVLGNPNINAGGTYNLVTSTNGGLNGANYQFQFYGLTNALVGGSNTTANNISVNLVALDPGDVPDTLYWKGGYAGFENIWAVSNGLPPPNAQSNWTVDRAGDFVVSIVPGETTDVIFATNNANTTYMQNTALGYDMRIRSLSVDGNASGTAGSSAVAVNDNDYTLTIVGGDSTAGTASIFVSHLTGGLALNTNVKLEADNPLITVGMMDGTSLGQGTLGISGKLSGNGFTKRGAGTMTLSGTASNELAGTTRVEQGNLILGKTGGAVALTGDALFIGEATPSSPARATVTLQADEQIGDEMDVTIYTGNTLQLAGNDETINGLNGSGSISSNVVGTATLTIGAGGSDGAFSGIISNGNTTSPPTMLVALTKTGEGTQILSGANTYTGLTSILGGTLQYGANNVIASGGVTVNGSTAVWDMHGFNDSVGTVTVAGGGRIIGEGSTLTSTATFQMQDGIVDVNLAGSVGLTKSSTGLVILNGNNTYTGTTTVGGASGILRVTTDGGLGSAAGGTSISGDSANGARLELSNNIVIRDALTIGARQGATANAVALSNFDGNNVWAGNVTFTTGGSNYNIESNTGFLTISGQVSGGGTTGGGRNLQLMGAGDGLISGAYIDGTGGATVNLFKLGTGTWTLSGASTYSGTTNVNAGKLRATNKEALGNTSRLTVAAGASFEYQSGAAGNNLNVAAITLNGGSTIGVEVGNTIAVTGAATTSGSITLDVFGISGFSYVNGQEYNVITAASGLDGATAYTLGKFYNLTNATVSGVDWNATRVWLNMQSAAELTTAYWKGGFATAENVWAVTNGTTQSNWASDQAGTNTPLVPGANTNVIFSSTGATNENPMTLGANMSIGTLTFNTASEVLLQDLSHTLTLNGAAAITVNTGAGLINLNTYLMLANGAPVIQVAASEELVIAGKLRGNAFTKAGGGTVTLAGNIDNDYSGTLRVHEGTVDLAKSANTLAVTGDLEIGNSGGSSATVRLMNHDQIANTSDVLINSGGVLNLNGSNEAIDGLTGTGLVTNTAVGTTSIFTIGANGQSSATFSGIIQDGAAGAEIRLVKTGAGTQTLTGANTYTGGTAINQGTIIVGQDNALSTNGDLTIGVGTTVGRLELNDHSQQVSSLRFTSNSADYSEVIIGEGESLTISGTPSGTQAFAIAGSGSGAQTNVRITGEGSFIINNAAANNNDFVMTHTSGGNPVMRLDMTGLARFEATVRNFDIINQSSGSLPKFEITLADSTRITANRMIIGGADASPHPSGSFFHFGQDTVLNSNSITFATRRSIVDVGFREGLVDSPTLKIRATNGTGRADLILGNNSPQLGGAIGGSSNPTAIVDFRGGTLDFLLDEVVLGASASVASNALGHGIGVLSFDGGTVDATIVYLGLAFDIGTAGTDVNPGDEIHGTLNVAGGNFTAGNISIAENRDASSGVNSFIRGQLNISGGVTNVTNNITVATHTSSSTGESIGEVNLTGGSVTVGGNITEGAGANGALNKSTVTLDGAALDMTNGTINVDTFNAISGRLSNLAQLNASGAAVDLTKTGAGKTLVLAGTNAYTGATIVSEGTLTAASSTALQGTSGLTVKSGATFNYNSGTLGSNLTLKSGAALTLENNSRVGVELGNIIVTQAAAVTTGANVTVDVYGITGATYNTQRYDVITATGGLNGAGASYQLGNFYNQTNYTVSGIQFDANAVWLNVTAATALTEAYWKGGFAGGANVWAISNGTSASNWATNLAGADTPLVPGANARVIFSATTSTNSEDMTLGADMSVGSLEFNMGTAVLLNDAEHELTLNHENAITVNGTGPVTLNTNLTLADDNAEVNTASGASLTLSGTTAGQGMTKTGQGRLAMTGTQTFTGALTLSGGTTYSASNTTAQSITVASGARLDAAGRLTSTGASGVNVQGILSVGDSSAALPTATTLSITTTGGVLAFANNSTLEMDLIDGAGTGGGASDLLVVTGTVNIGSNVMLDVDVNDMVAWALGDTWKLFDWTGLTSLTGSFATLELDTILDGTDYRWDYSKLYTDGTISIAAVPEPSRAVLLVGALVLLATRRRRSVI